MKWFFNVKIRYKLLLGFSLIIIIAAFLSLEGISKIRQIDESDAELYENMTVPLSYLQAISTSFQMIRVDTRDIIIASTKEEFAKKYKTIQELRSDIVNNSEKFQKTIISDEMKIAFNEFLDTRKEYVRYVDQVIVLAEQNRDAEATALLYGDAKKAADAEMKAINNMVQMKVKHAEEKSDDNTLLADSAVKTMLILLGLGIIAAAAIGLTLSSYLSKHIAQIVERFNSLNNLCLANLSRGSDELSKGNLDIKIATGTMPLQIDSEDELGQLSSSVNEIISKIQTIIHSVEGAASVIKNMVEESKLLVNAAINGRLSERGDEDKFQGGYRDVIKGLNETFEAVVKPINEAGGVLEILAQGDLTARMVQDYPGDYKKLKESINTLSESMNNALSNVSDAIEATASSAEEISSSTEQLSAGTQEQSQQASEIASAVEQMTKTIFESSKSISDAAAMSNEASSVVEKGTQKVSQTQKGIEKIVVSTEQTSRIITSLAGKSEQIGEITQVIDDIADQTNLLALNAAIEAARAGEQGRGFAVVADEVRKLAERTTKATKEIADTIKQIQIEARNAENSMGDARHAVEEGMKLTKDVADVLTEILAGSQGVSNMVTQVAAAGEEQSATAEQISKNIDSISAVTNQTASGTGQIALAAGDLSRLTLKLKDLISQFKLTTEKGQGTRDRGHGKEIRKLRK